MSLSPVSLKMVRGHLFCHLYGDVRGHCGLGKGRMKGHRTNTWEGSQVIWGVKSLTGSCKDDRGGYATSLARSRGSRARGITVAAEEAAISEDEQLQGAVWGDWGSQGSRRG